jgi:hypothetical protein
MTERKSKKFYTAVVIVIALLAAMTIAFGNEHQTDKLIALGAGSTLVPTGVNNTLNITFSDVTYSTVAPAFEFDRGNYNTNATWINPGKTDVNVTNATYLVMQSTLTGANPAQVQYDLAHYNKNASYFFMEAKLAANLTDLTGISIVLSDSGVSSYFASANSATVGTGSIVVNIASTGALTATANETATSYASGTASGTTTISALQFYDLTVYVHKDTSTTDTVAVALINPANGAVLGTSTMTGISGVNFSKLDYAAFQFGGGSAFGPAMILDWGYFVFAGTSGATVSSSAVMGDATTPYVLGAASGINGAFAPFDPSAANNTQYKQAPNATYVHTNTATGDKDFNLSSSVLSNETAAQLSVGAYNITSKATFGVGNNTSANSTAMVANLTINKENTNSFTADVHISTFNATGIQTAVMNFLKNYTANLATINTGIAYSYKNMSIISYMISNIQTVTNLSASDASAVRDYFDNGFASVLKESNMSLVDTNTTAIVAGAFAGDFYYQGMALVPEIQGNAIINPVTGQKFANLSDAGFAAGAYISGGAVIVPQATIIGWDAGTPIFASGFSFGSFFGGLTSAGSAIEHYLGNGVSDLSNVIGSQAKAVTNYVVKPITSTASNAAKTVTNDIAGFRTGIANLTSSIVPAIGTAVNNVESSVKGALGPISGAVSDLSSSLASAKNGIVTAVAAGASGIKSDIYTLGTQIKNGTQGIVNTLGAKISATDAVLSSMFTAIKSIPGAISTKLTSVASSLKNSTLSALDTVGSTITGAVNGVKTTVTNAFGDVANKIVGVAGYIKNGLNTAWSFITSFGAKLGFILEIVGITIAAIVIVGLILYFGVMRRESSMVAGESHI